jgi:hypothetical protein
MRRIRTPLLIAGSLLGAFLLPAHAQFLQPAPNSVPVGSTIAVTNTFQVALTGANGNRYGCTIQNNGTHTMWAFFGSGTASESASLQIPAAGTIYCATAGGPVAQDEVQITGTSGDAYVVVSQ